MRLLAATIFLLSLMLAGCSTRKPPEETIPATAEALGAWSESEPNYEVALVMDLNQHEENTSAAWLGYLLARTRWIDENLITASERDFQAYAPRAGEELTGRETLAELWRNFRQKGASPDQYLDALARIEEQGYLEPYVWRYHSESAWGEAPGDLPWVRFDQWMARELPGFQPVTRGSIRLLPPGATEQKTREAQAAQKQASR